MALIALRLTITIAHRLSTIRKPDVIHVMHEGVTVESGLMRNCWVARAGIKSLFRRNCSIFRNGEVGLVVVFRV